jgi:hypothetical protein
VPESTLCSLQAYGLIFRMDYQMNGQIGYFGLTAWWFATFSPAERTYIESTFQPIGIPSGQNLLTTGKIEQASGTAGGLLGSLSSWFNKRPEDLDLALRILKKAEELSAVEHDVLSLHFAYQARIQLNYRWRAEVIGALDAAVEACKQQIGIAPQAAEALQKEFEGRPLPMHVGYEQLAILREKQCRFAEGIELCREAMQLEWAGTWEKRIARMEARKRKVNS